MRFPGRKVLDMKQKLKVLMLTNWLPPDHGGGGLQMQRLAAGIQESGVDCTILAGTKNANLTGKGNDRIPTIRFRVFGMGKIRNLAFLAGTFSWIIFNGSKFDILHMTCLNWAGMAGILFMRLLGRKSIMKFSLKGIDDPFSIRKSALGALKYRILNKLDRYVCTSASLAGEIRKNLPDFSEKIAVIPNGVDINLFRPIEWKEKEALRQKLGLPVEGMIFNFTGIVIQRKGVDILFRAWADFFKRVETPVCLVMTGPMGVGCDPFASKEFEDELMDFFRENGLEQTVVFTGRTERVPDYLKASDVFVFPSRREGLPNALIEAQAAGLACIASDIEGCRDVIEDGRNGLLFDIDDNPEKNLLACIEKVFSDTELRNRLATGARETAVDQYSFENIIEKYLEIYKEMVPGKFQ